MKGVIQQLKKSGANQNNFFNFSSILARSLILNVS